MLHIFLGDNTCPEQHNNKFMVLECLSLSFVSLLLFYLSSSEFNAFLFNPSWPREGQTISLAQMRNQIHI